MIPSALVLKLREFESAAIGPTWDTARKTVPPYVVAELERIQSEHGTEFLTITRRQITAKNYVGVVGIGERAIEILPKTDEGSDAARKRLVEMLSVAGIFPHLDAGVVDLASSVPCLLDAFMQAYIRQLMLEWRRGRILNYGKTDENRTFLRGKLIFSEQIRRNRLRPERTFTRADQFHADVAPSRLLKAGLSVCRRHGFADATRRGATTLLSEFEDVAIHNFTDHELDAIRPDRRISRFEPLMTLARWFIRGRVPDRPGRERTYSLLFNMSAVFERYIGCLLRRACPGPYRVQLQVQGRSLVLRDGRREFWLRPDAAVRRIHDFSLLIDTKWKLLDPKQLHAGVLQSDMYQAYAYAREFACPHVLLIYPRSADQSRCVACYRLHPGNDASPRIDITTVDITKRVDQVRDELRAILDAAGINESSGRLGGPVS